MIQEKFYLVTITEVTSGVREQTDYTRLYDSEHPKMKEPNPPEQYGFKTSLKSFIDKKNVLEQRVDSVDVERVLKAINKGL